MSPQPAHLLTLARKLGAISGQFEGLHRNHACSCDGECRICAALVQLTNDTDLLGRLCAEAANIQQLEDSAA